MTALFAVTLALVAFGATGVALIRAPVRQAITLSFFGLMLAVLFFEFQAPDVALSEITVGSMVLPLLILLAVSKTRGRRL